MSADGSSDAELSRQLASTLGLPDDWAQNLDDPPPLSTFGDLRNRHGGAVVDPRSTTPPTSLR